MCVPVFLYTNCVILLKALHWASLSLPSTHTPFSLSDYIHCLGLLFDWLGFALSSLASGTPWELRYTLYWALPTHTHTHRRHVTHIHTQSIPTIIISSISSAANKKQASLNHLHLSDPDHDLYDLTPLLGKHLWLHKGDCVVCNSICQALVKLIPCWLNMHELTGHLCGVWLGHYAKHQVSSLNLPYSDHINMVMVEDVFEELVCRTMVLWWQTWLSWIRWVSYDR